MNYINNARYTHIVTSAAGMRHIKTNINFHTSDFNANLNI